MLDVNALGGKGSGAHHRLSLGHARIALVVVQTMEVGLGKVAIGSLFFYVLGRKRDLTLLIVVIRRLASPAEPSRCFRVVAGLGLLRPADGKIERAIGRDAGGGEIDAGRGVGVNGERDSGPGDIGSWSDAINLEEGGRAKDGSDETTGRNGQQRLSTFRTPDLHATGQERQHDSNLVLS